MNALQIRDARESDRDAIREVTLSAFGEYAAVMPAHWEGYRNGILAALADVKSAEQIVGEREGAIVGAVLLYPAGAIFERSSFPLVCPEIRLLVVAPTARGLGIGGALMRECIRRARRSGASALTLHTSDFMHIGKGMYERMGFAREPELDFHPARDLTVMGYRLNLDDAAR